MATPPTVSVVIEASVNDKNGLDLTVMDTLRSLHEQDYPRELVELLVAQTGWSPGKKELVRSRYPGVRVLDSPTGGYFHAKNVGIKEARGEVIALADADCVYPNTWISSIVGSLEKDRDVAVGVTHYAGSSLLHRLCAFYNFHCSLIHSPRRQRRFTSSNVGYRADVIKSTLYDEQFERSGACVLLADRLMKKGSKFSFSPEQVALHAFEDVRTHIFLRVLRNGNDFIRTRQASPTMPLGSLMKVKWIAPPIAAAAFLASDIYNLAQNRTLVRARWFELPVFVLFSAFVRAGEIIGMYWTLVHPDSLRRAMRG
jgi:glycosyltransferase involved in cell wall biosynthesis